MKTLYVARHAKSSWLNFAKPDLERPLNDRGNRDAPEMARRVLKRRMDIDVFISSPAKRARETCAHFCNIYKHDPAKIILNDKLYHASVKTFYELVRALDDRYDYVAIFSHNPGITDFVNTLCENVRVDNVPTAGVFGIEMEIREWKKFKEKKNQYLFFDYPKS